MFLKQGAKKREFTPSFEWVAWVLLGVIAKLLPQTGVTGFPFLVSASPFRFSGSFGAKTRAGSLKILHSGLAAKSVQSLTPSSSLDIPTEGALSQLLGAPSLAAGKRETRFRGTIQLLVQYLSQVA